VEVDGQFDLGHGDCLVAHHDMVTVVVAITPMLESFIIFFGLLGLWLALAANKSYVLTLHLDLFFATRLRQKTSQFCSHE